MGAEKKYRVASTEYQVANPEPHSVLGTRYLVLNKKPLPAKPEGVGIGSGLGGVPSLRD